MHPLDFLLSIDNLITRVRQRPVWVRALLIIGIALVASWLIAQGILRGLASAWVAPSVEDMEQQQLLWHQYGLPLTGLLSLMVILFLHSFIGDPTHYSDTSKIALGLQLLSIPILFDVIGVCVCGSFLFCFTPIAAFVGAVHGIKFRGKLWPPAGDWLVLGLYIAYAILLWNYFYAWNPSFID